uniref:Uncharacterized protein n=1 Tax=Anguilla anguilla TaxID=7936 RepID=A0A0E9W923_ANGAN
MDVTGSGSKMVKKTRALLLLCISLGFAACHVV